MASTSKDITIDSSDSDSEKETNRSKFKNVQIRQNRPQKYRTEWENKREFKDWLKPVKGKILVETNNNFYYCMYFIFRKMYSCKMYCLRCGISSRSNCTEKS